MLNERYVIELTADEVDEMNRYIIQLDLHEGLNTIEKENLVKVYSGLQEVPYHSRTSLHLMTRIRVIAEL